MALNPDAQAELNGILHQDAAKNRVAVHSFDPNATPEQKAAAAGKGREKLKKVGGDQSTAPPNQGATMNAPYKCPS